jgi:PAT family acetyl-CoA transporter-like MFS transporter 1
MPAPAGAPSPIPSLRLSTDASLYPTQHHGNEHSQPRVSTSEDGFELQPILPQANTKRKTKQNLRRARATDDLESAHLIHTDSSDSDSSFDANHPMSKRAGRKGNPKLAVDSSPAGSPTNGNANTSATMQNNILEHRRKHSTTDPSSPSSQAASLMGHSSFSLDDPVPDHDEGVSKGFMELSRKDQNNFLLLVLLYFLQGIPMGLAMGSVPFLLKQVVSYSSIGVFSLAAYPYSLKLLWSPIVDAVWTPKVGRRKSWILPIQLLSGVAMLWLSTEVNGMMAYAGEKDSGGIWSFTRWWFALVFLCATQDIAVDGKDTFALLF